ncbi:hypothetical protein IAU60_004199 [Kwoniella sp. DSM 27419]
MPARHRPQPDKPSSARQIPPSAYIQAFEARLVYGADDLAREVASRDTRRGVGLIRYQGGVAGDADREAADTTEIWADRYDILHLLSTVPVTAPIARASSIASSSSSWDSLPSDVEETFHLSDPEDIERHEVEKKKRWMAALREDRLREREREDRSGGGAVAAAAEVIALGWSADEEPPAHTLATMRHTALALASSPNPSVLELRILANHASDDRFSFLRGRYKDAWEGVKAELRRTREEQRRAEERKKGLGLGGLGGYDSDSDSASDSVSDSGPGSRSGSPSCKHAQAAPPSSPPPPPPPPLDGAEPVPPPLSPGTPGQDLEPRVRSGSLIPPHTKEQIEEEEKKRQRRLRAEEWKRKRRIGAS